MRQSGCHGLRKIAPQHHTAGCIGNEIWKVGRSWTHRLETKLQRTSRESRTFIGWEIASTNGSPGFTRCYLSLVSKSMKSAVIKSLISWWINDKIIMNLSYIYWMFVICRWNSFMALTNKTFFKNHIHSFLVRLFLTFVEYCHPCQRCLVTFPNFQRGPETLFPAGNNTLLSRKVQWTVRVIWTTLRLSL